jgi:rhomboid protease GluP
MRVPQANPFWTYAILAINVLAFLATWVLGENFVLGLGAKVNAAIVEGQYWRLFTAMFLHLGLLHIGFNSYALYLFGPQVERPFGPVRFLLIYVLSGLSGSAFSFLFSPNPSVGASGAIFGLIGVMGAYLYRYRDRLAMGRSRLMNLVSIAAYNLLYGFVVPSVDNWGHIGGLVAGLALGWLLAPRYEVVQTNVLAPPQIEDQSSAAQWLLGAVLVSLGIGLVIAGGMVRWGAL